MSATWKSWPGQFCTARTEDILATVFKMDMLGLSAHQIARRLNMLEVSVRRILDAAGQHNPGGELTVH